MIRALRFSAGKAPEARAPADLPECPGGDIWCDLDRSALRTSDHAAPGDAIAGVHRWLDALHAATSDRLRRPVPLAFATAQEGYVHVRLAVLAPPPSPTGRPGTEQRERAAAAPGRKHAVESPPNGPARARGHRRTAAAGEADGTAGDPLDLVFGPGFALTVRQGPLPAIDDAWRQYASGARRAESVDIALYGALDAALARLRAATDELMEATDELSMQLVDLRARRILRQIVRLRRLAARLRAVVAPWVDGLRLLAAATRGRGRGDRCAPLYDDLHDQARELMGAVDDARATLSEAVEAYTSVQSTEMNRVMQLFTVVAVVFMPPTLIASIYGMNFRIPEYRWPFGYAWALGLMGAISGLLILWMHRRRWL